jgi:hypothetical protein
VLQSSVQPVQLQSSASVVQLIVTEMNSIQFDLVGTHNRTCVPYLAVTDRILSQRCDAFIGRFNASVTYWRMPRCRSTRAKDKGVRGIIQLCPLECEGCITADDDGVPGHEITDVCLQGLKASALVVWVLHIDCPSSLVYR